MPYAYFLCIHMFIFTFGNDMGCFCILYSEVLWDRSLFLSQFPPRGWICASLNQLRLEHEQFLGLNDSLRMSSSLMSKETFLGLRCVMAVVKFGYVAPPPFSATTTSADPFPLSDMNKPLTAGQITDHWALTTIYPPPSSSPSFPSNCPSSLTHTAHPLVSFVPDMFVFAYLFIYIWLNWIRLFPCLLTPFSLSYSVFFVVVAAAVKAYINQLCKQTS